MNGLGKMTKGVQLSGENSEGRFFRVRLELGMQRSQLTVRSILSRPAIFCEEIQRFFADLKCFWFGFSTKKRQRNKHKLLEKPRD